MSAPSAYYSGSLGEAQQEAKMFPSSHPTKIFVPFPETNDQPEIERPVLPISTEFDMIRTNYYSKVQVDRSRWMAEVLEEHPEVKDLRSRFDPMYRSIEFGRLYLPDDRLISHNTLLSLVSQHLRTLGLVESHSSLHSEWDGDFNIPTSLSHSQLTFLIQRGVKHAERFWELTMPGTMPSDADQKQLLEEISKVIGGSPVVTDDVRSLKDEPYGDPQYLIIKQGDERDKILFASANQLIWICTTDSPYRTDELINAVCLVYTSIAEPNVFFAKIKERFSLAFEEQPADKMRHSVDLTYKFLVTWLDQNAKELDSSLIQTIRSFIDNEVRPRFPRLCAGFRITPNKHEKAPDYSAAPKVEYFGEPNSLWVGEFDITSLPPVEFARQLTIHTMSRFYAIKPSEFLYKAWEDSRLMHRSPNIVKLIQMQDEFTSWAASVMVGSASKTNQQRIDSMTYFLQVAERLYEMQNLLNTAWIMYAFEQNPVYRLRNALLKQVDRKLRKFRKRVFDILLDDTNSYKKAIDAAYAALKTGKPMMPFLVPFLGEIGKYSAVHEDKFKKKNGSSPKDLVDVGISLEIYRYVQKLVRFQKERYVFLPIDQAQDFLENIPPMDMQEVDKVSRAIRSTKPSPSGDDTVG